MPKPIIAVDRDDVLALHYKALAAYAKEHHGLPEPTVFHSDFPVLYGIDLPAAEKLLWDFNLAGVHGSFELMPHALEVLHHLSKDYNLIIISTQIKQNFDIVETWILEHFPDIFSEIILLHPYEGDMRTKADMCLDRGAQYLIDDRLKNIKQAAEAGVTGLVFGGHEGKDEAPHDNIVFTDDWLAVQEYFDALAR